MRTNDLIELLASGVEPVDGRGVNRALVCASLLAIAVAIAAMVSLFGVRGYEQDAHGVPFIFAKLAFAGAIFVIAVIFLLRTARPGGERQTSAPLLAIPFIIVGLLALVTITVEPRIHSHEMVFGNDWLSCLLFIPALAIPSFLIIIWSLRRAAPTDLRRAGAFAGVAAGAASAAGYALHCVDDSLPFIALWYGAAILGCALGGAVIGPRLLRW